MPARDPAAPARADVNGSTMLSRDQYGMSPGCGRGRQRHWPLRVRAPPAPNWQIPSEYSHARVGGRGLGKQVAASANLPADTRPAARCNRVNCWAPCVAGVELVVIDEVRRGQRPWGWWPSQETTARRHRRDRIREAVVDARQHDQVGAPAGGGAGVERVLQGTSSSASPCTSSHGTRIAGGLSRQRPRRAASSASVRFHGHPGLSSIGPRRARR